MDNIDEALISLILSLPEQTKIQLYQELSQGNQGALQQAMGVMPQGSDMEQRW